MNIRNTSRLGMLIAPLLLSGTAAAASAVEIRQAAAGGDIGSTTIRVDGAGDEHYDSVRTSSLDIWASVRGKDPDGEAGFKYLRLSAEGQTIVGTRPVASWKTYRITLPYVDPRSQSVANLRVSPVKRCNEHLQSLSGGARAGALKEGFKILLRNAYSLHALAAWDLHPGGSPGPGFEEPYQRDFTDDSRADAILDCVALDRPKPRTQTSTQGVDPQPGTHLPPTIKKLDLRIEPAAIELVDGQRCPTSLKLYGAITTARAFDGGALFVGPGFISPVTPLDFPDDGTRTVRGTYPLNWGGEPGLAGAAPVSGRSRTLTIRFNITGKNNQVIESTNDTIKVTCELVEPKNPLVGAGSLAPSAAIVNFDAKIRRVDRSGPQNGTQAWIYNAGPDVAKDCELHANGGTLSQWEKITTVDVASGNTVLVNTSLLPRGPNLKFRLNCPQEPAGKRGNNTYMLR